MCHRALTWHTYGLLVPCFIYSNLLTFITQNKDSSTLYNQCLTVYIPPVPVGLSVEELDEQ